MNYVLSTNYENLLSMTINNKIFKLLVSHLDNLINKWQSQ